MKKLLVLCSMLCCYSASNADALTITVADDIADNTYLSSGSSLTGKFEINSAIPVGGQFNLPYSIPGATATFQFTDDLQDLTRNNPITGAYVQYQKINNDTWYRRYLTQWSVNENEKVQLNILGQISSDGTTWYQNALTNSGQQTLDETIIKGQNNNPQTSYYYSQLQTGENGYKGTVTLVEALDLNGLTDLSSDGVVPFTLSMLEGDMMYQSGNLVAELNANPLPPAAPVPEPGTMMLLGTGFLGLAIYGKRRRNA